MKHVLAASGGRSVVELNGAKGRLQSSAIALSAAVPPPRAAPPPVRQRTKLWDLHPSTHCSVIGTCMTTAELRSVMGKWLGSETAALSDHDLHKEAVGMCSRQDTGSKLLHKALDRRHQAAINRFAQLKTEADIVALWIEERKAGNIPGAYWAVLTHPSVGEVALRRAFGDVHMLSHLVGAANRADIRRLAMLEEENAALAAKVARQQQRVHEAITARDTVIRQLAASAGSDDAQPSLGSEDAAVALRHVVDDLRMRLSAEIGRRERVEHRVREAIDAQRQWEARAIAVEANVAALQRELESLEFVDGAQDASPCLPKERILYVGGRPGTVEQAREMLGRAGGELLSHDGGLHDHPSLLAGLIGRADRVVFPVDCISHDAALSVKRLCRQLGKCWTPLRSSGLASFLASLANPIVQEQFGVSREG